jgi:hypothetical protein
MNYNAMFSPKIEFYEEAQKLVNEDSSSEELSPGL